METMKFMMIIKRKVFGRTNHFLFSHFHHHNSFLRNTDNGNEIEQQTFTKSLFAEAREGLLLLANFFVHFLACNNANSR